MYPILINPIGSCNVNREFIDNLKRTVRGHVVFQIKQFKFWTTINRYHRNKGTGKLIVVRNLVRSFFHCIRKY